MIGRHFPEIDDKLYNLLEFADNNVQSELLLASIDQRSSLMRPIPFTKAIDFKENFKYLKYLAIPAVLLSLLWISGISASFFGSSQRIVNYDVAYEPPAPFSFKLMSNELNVLNDRPFTIFVATEGEIRPDIVFIVIENDKRVLHEQNGVFQYTFTMPMQSVEFYFEANDIRSRTYQLNVRETPTIQNFELLLDYPPYTNRMQEILKGTGNAVFPEGTRVTWSIQGQHTDKISIVTEDTTRLLVKEGKIFSLSQKVYANLPYELATANKHVDNYERLAYEFRVIKDAYPEIQVKDVKDSLSPNTVYYIGEISDDYLIRKVELVYYTEDDETNAKRLKLLEPNSNLEQFYYTFPSGLQLEAGKNYSYHFEVTDNDAIHGGKVSKSQVFSTALLDDDELRNKDLELQQDIIDNIDKSLDKFKEQEQSLKEINRGQKEKKELNFNDQSRIKDFLQKQQQQESMMQKFSKQLKENLNKSENEDKMNELLKERLERQEMEARKNEKLLEELNKVADKIDKEELAKKLDELGKKQQNSQRSLEQLLELTKRYYVSEKAAQLARDLEKLADRQEKAAENNKESEEANEQNELNKAFEKLAEELKELDKDNQDLKKQLPLEFGKEEQEAVKTDQKEASDELNKRKSKETSDNDKQEARKKASQKQKSASQKMKKMSKDLAESSANGGAGGSSVSEDAEMLRQILDNLVTFSFKQEGLFDSLEDIDSDISQFSGSIKEQQELRELFEHVDDSLFALSLRRAELSEFVNEQITEVFYNMDKALESIAENQIYQGVSYQKYVLNASNSLSDFLANILDNMQESMQSGSGQGDGQDAQLPDIIKSQGELKQKMEGQGKEGQGNPQGTGGQGKKGEGKNGEAKGDVGKEGTSGKGEKGKSNGEGNEGEEGNGGQGNKGKQGQGEGGGTNGQGGVDTDNGPSEKELREIYEIYKEQQVIRNRLEQQLQNMINGSDRKLGEKLIRQMEDFENELLDRGFTQQGLNRLNTIQYELLKLENAALKQGRKSDRESVSNNNRFTNTITSMPEQLENYRNEIEILNRQALPLRQNYKIKVKEYFKNND